MSLHIWDSRTLCEVLGEMRQCVKTQNYSYLSGLIEEVQVMGNRMEAGLSDQRDIAKLTEAKHKLKAEYKELKKKVKDAGGKVESDSDE